MALGTFAGFVRVLQTYLRFLNKNYLNAHKLKQRAASMLPVFICKLIRCGVGSNETKYGL